MINPSNLENIRQVISTTNGLEEFALFSILVAGKTAFQMSHALEILLTQGRQRFNSDSPFEIVKQFTLQDGEDAFAQRLKSIGIGCHKAKSFYLRSISFSGIDLSTCSLEELETLPGFGPKTARFFLMFTRPGVEYAALDTHILGWLRDKGYDVPKNTPSSYKRYQEIEDLWLEEARKEGPNTTAVDLDIWNSRRRKWKGQ